MNSPYSYVPSWQREEPESSSTIQELKRIQHTLKYAVKDLELVLSSINDKFRQQQSIQSDLFFEIFDDDSFYDEKIWLDIKKELRTESNFNIEEFIKKFEATRNEIATKHKKKAPPISNSIRQNILDFRNIEFSGTEKEMGKIKEKLQAKIALYRLFKWQEEFIQSLQVLGKHLMEMPEADLPELIILPELSARVLSPMYKTFVDSIYQIRNKQNPKYVFLKTDRTTNYNPHVLINLQERIKEIINKFSLSNDSKILILDDYGTEHRQTLRQIEGSIHFELPKTKLSAFMLFTGIGLKCRYEIRDQSWNVLKTFENKNDADTFLEEQNNEDLFIKEQYKKCEIKEPPNIDVLAGRVDPVVLDRFEQELKDYPDLRPNTTSNLNAIRGETIQKLTGVTKIKARDKLHSIPIDLTPEEREFQKIAKTIMKLFGNLAFEKLTASNPL